MRNDRIGARRAYLTLVTVVMAGALAACGGSSGPQVASLDGGTGTKASASASASGAADREASAREFASCMRKNGVTKFPDPTVDSNGNVQMGLGPDSGINRDDPAVRKAFTACRPLIEALRPQFTPEQRQQFQDSLLKYAQCMRTNGYQMADPDFSGNGGGLRALGQLNLQDPLFRKADAICRPKTLGNLPFGPGRGPGGGGPPPSGAPTPSVSGAAA